MWGRFYVSRRVEEESAWLGQPAGAELYLTADTLPSRAFNSGLIQVNRARIRSPNSQKHLHALNVRTEEPSVRP